ncbi:recombinase family protein [Oscillibacter sp.]|uniref:recombinase family protein n=1 Tax=Oscillibacter sp. TaxID=1945593 RepID=UPI0037CC2E4D
MLKDERYTGKAINRKYRIKTPGKRGGMLLQPKEEWMVVPDKYPVLIPAADFKAAHAALWTKPANISDGHIFYRKMKCPVCGHTMRRSGKYDPHFYCKTGQFTDHYKLS